MYSCAPIPPFDAIVLAGGRARRLDGADKPGLMVGESNLLDHVLTAVASAHRRIVVGPLRPTIEPVIWSREEPIGSGPLAAVAAGLTETSADVVLVLAADLPWLGPAVPVLLTTLSADHRADAAMLVDAAGRRNLLAAAWRRPALHRQLARAGSLTNRPMRTLCEAANIIEVADADGWGADCDTWADLAVARGRAARTATNRAASGGIANPDRFERQGR